MLYAGCQSAATAISPCPSCTAAGWSAGWTRRLTGRKGLFEIKALHLEPGVPVSDELVTDLAAVLRRLAAWHGTPELVVRQSDPPELAALLGAAW